MIASTWAPTAAVSASMCVCVTLFMMSCLACKKFFRRKKNLDGDEEAVDGVVLTKITDDKTETNGVSNIGYENEKNSAETKSDDDKKVDPSVDAESNDISPEESQARLSVVANEEPRRSRNVIPMTEGDLFCRNEEKQDEECPEKEKDEEENNEEENNDAKTNEPIENVETDQHSEKTEYATANEANDEEKAKSPINQDRFKVFSSSIRSNDVDDLSFVLNDLVLKPSTAIESESSPPVKQDFSQYDDVCLQGGWRRIVKVTDLLEMGLIDRATADEIREVLKTSDSTSVEDTLPDQVRPYIYGKSPLAGILLSESGEKKSIFRSAKDGIIRRGTAISLLEAQAATGNIIDPLTGRKMSVNEAFELGLLDKVYETVVSRAERAIVGYKTRVTENTLSLGEAMEKGFVMESHGYRLLEAQLATGGIIDHKTNIRLPLSLAIDRGLVGSKMAGQLKMACEETPNDETPDDLKTFCDPNTEENVTYSELLRRSVVDSATGMRLYPLEKIRRRRLSYGSYSGRSSLASSRASSKESIPAAVAAATTSS